MLHISRCVSSSTVIVNTRFIALMSLRAGCSTCRLELTSRLTLELSRSALHHAKIHELTT